VTLIAAVRAGRKPLEESGFTLERPGTRVIFNVRLGVRLLLDRFADAGIVFTA